MIPWYRIIILFRNKIWDILSPEIKKSENLKTFKAKIKNWILFQSFCRLCHTYLPQIGLIWKLINTLINKWYLKKANLNIEESPYSSSKLRKNIHLATLTTFSKEHCLVWFWVFFCNPSSQIATLDMMLKECKQLLGSPVMSNSTLRKLVQRFWI